MTRRITFDEVLPTVTRILNQRSSLLRDFGAIFIIRDLWGRARLATRAPTSATEEQTLQSLAVELSAALGNHGYPPNRSVLSLTEVAGAWSPRDAIKIEVETLDDVFVVDRQLSGLSWSHVEATNTDAKRCVFFSMKGGVGRSTATAIAARHFAKRGKRVLVLDLDLESPGLSTSLLPPDRQPSHGLADWFVEDLVNSSDSLLSEMIGRSPFADNLPGGIFVAPAHGKNPGDYIAKIGRASLPTERAADQGENPEERWEDRLRRLVALLEGATNADVTLIDSRAGLHDTASVVVTDLGAQVLLFGINTEQTWTAYEILFDHWRRTGAVMAIRERLQMIAAMVPETDRPDYLSAFREQAWDLFRDHLYDEISGPTSDAFSFDLAEEHAPHTPVPIFWSRGMASLGAFVTIDEQQVDAFYSHFLAAIDRLFGVE